MGKLKASIADVSTDFQLIEPGIYTFEIKKYEDIEKDGDWVSTRITSEVISGDDDAMKGKKFSDFIYIRKPGETIDAENIGLKNIKRYFEVLFGKEKVKEWSDEDFDTDLLIGKQFVAHVAISSYTKKGETEPRQTNELKRMEAA